MNYEILLIAVFITAFLYSSVGHGGASGYLAIMALAGMAPEVMKSSALLLNLFVSGIALVLYKKAGYFNTKLLLTITAGSVPAAYLGAQVQVNPSLYKIILAICLIIAVGRILYKSKADYTEIKKAEWYILIPVGIVLGFLSGMIGIGGGILLSPLLILFRWSTIKQAAGISAAFILLNSLSGLAALINKGFMPGAETYSLIIIAAFGGLAGSFLGSTRFSVRGLKYVLANVLVFAAIKLMMF
jgi:uncharacterized protein